MRIAFVGKGGAGKTTLAALFTRYLHNLNLPVEAIDADINQHLAAALGGDGTAAAHIPPLGAHLRELKEYLRGTNPRITSADAMTKTTPAGHGSNLLCMKGSDPFHAKFARTINGMTLMATGPFAQEDLGVACYHSKTAAVELYLNHLLDGQGEYTIVDMTAGADSFASGLFSRFDITFLVAEPTVRGVSVYRQYRDYASEYGINLRVIGNKVEGDDDIAFLQDEVGESLLTCIGRSPFVRQLEKGRHPAFADLEPEARTALATMLATVDATPKDWARLQRQAVLFHRRNAAAWANDRTGEDLTRQIDPTFVMGSVAAA